MISTVTAPLAQAYQEPCQRTLSSCYKAQMNRWSVGLAVDSDSYITACVLLRGWDGCGGILCIAQKGKDFECACGIAIYTRIIINLLWFTGLLGGVQISGL